MPFFEALLKLPWNHLHSPKKNTMKPICNLCEILLKPIMNSFGSPLKIPIKRMKSPQSSKSRLRAKEFHRKILWDFSEESFCGIQRDFRGFEGVYGNFQGISGKITASYSKDLNGFQKKVYEEVSKTFNWSFRKVLDGFQTGISFGEDSGWDEIKVRGGGTEEFRMDFKRGFIEVSWMF